MNSTLWNFDLFMLKKKETILNLFFFCLHGIFLQVANWARMAFFMYGGYPHVKLSNENEFGPGGPTSVGAAAYNSSGKKLFHL